MKPLETGSCTSRTASASAPARDARERRRRFFCIAGGVAVHAEFLLGDDDCQQYGTDQVRGGKPLTTSGRARLAGARFAGPRRFARPAAEAAGVALKTVRFVPSLAYRLALVASGEIDVAISGPNAHDWDIAAADLLVQEAGGVFGDLAGRTPRYNRSEIMHPVLVASAPAIADEVTALIASVETEESDVS